jgi:hypothetical protein
MGFHLNIFFLLSLEMWQLLLMLGSLVSIMMFSMVLAAVVPRYNRLESADSYDCVITECNGYSCKYTIEEIGYSQIILTETHSTKCYYDGKIFLEKRSESYYKRAMIGFSVGIVLSFVMLVVSFYYLHKELQQCGINVINVV